MTTENFYEQLLGVSSPWLINKVDLAIVDERVDIYVEFKGKAMCPECNEVATIHDYTKERTWRHLDSCQMKTYIHCRLPRTKCDSCKVKTLAPSWSKSSSRFTLMFEAFVIKVLLATKCDTQTASILRLTQKEVLGIKNRAVDRGLERRGELTAPEVLAIDEKSYGHGQKYITVLLDQDEDKVVEVGPDRTEVEVEKLFLCYSEEEREKVESITMDMWRPFKNKAEECLINSLIIHDRYHIASHMGKALETTRRAEQKTLDPDEQDLLKGLRFALLRSIDNRTEKDFEKLAGIESSNLDTARVFMMKEMLREIYESPISALKAALEIKSWIALAKEQSIAGLTRVAKTIENHLEGICNYFHNRLTNAKAETKNGFIQELKTRARGFRNWQRYRINILFHFGKLDLDPQ
jgi:transposase